MRQHCHDRAHEPTTRQVPYFEIDFIRIHHPLDPPDDAPPESAPSVAPGSFLSHTGSRSEPDDGSSTAEGRVGPSRVRLTNTVEIRTDLDGYNSGRVYYVRAESGAECRRIAEDLNAFSRVARRHFELRSRWERARDRIKTAYESPWVQGLVGALILAVNARAFDRA